MHPTLKDSFVTAALALLAIATSIGAGWIVLAPEHDAHSLNGTKSHLSDAEEQQLVKDKEILDFAVVNEKGEAYVSFAYVGASLPTLLDEKEAVGARTATSFTKDLGTTPGGTEKILETVSYPRPQFYERLDGWHFIEYAKVRKENFDAVHAKNPLSFLIRSAHAASASIFSDAGDGQVFTLSQASWAAARDATSGNAAPSDGESHALVENILSNCGTEKDPVPCNLYSVYRTFLPFDTSSIPLGSTITAATLNLYVNGVEDTDNDGTDYVTVVQTSQATHTTLVSNDFDNIGTTEGVDSGQRKDITSISTAAYLTFTLNSTGLGWIKTAGQSSNCSATAGITCLGVREGHDNTNTEVASSGQTGVNFSNAESASTTFDPYLSVTYSLPFAFWQFEPF